GIEDDIDKARLPWCDRQSFLAVVMTDRPTMGFGTRLHAEDETFDRDRRFTRVGQHVFMRFGWSTARKRSAKVTGLPRVFGRALPFPAARGSERARQGEHADD